MNIVEFVARNGYYRTLEKLAGTYSDQANSHMSNIQQGVGGGGQYNAPAHMGAAPVAKIAPVAPVKKAVQSKPDAAWIKNFTNNTLAKSSWPGGPTPVAAAKTPSTAGNWIKPFTDKTLSGSTWGNSSSVVSGQPKPITPRVQQGMARLKGQTPTLQAMVNKSIPSYPGL